MSKRDRAADRTKATIPFDPKTRDIICRRAPTGQKDLLGADMMRVEYNIDQAVIHHSPTGFEWGYAGSGPADYALNILNLFVPPRADGFPPVKCWWGQCSRTAWDLHQSFKNAYLANMPHLGGVIAGQVIEKWLAARAGEVN